MIFKRSPLWAIKRKSTDRPWYAARVTLLSQIGVGQLGTVTWDAPDLAGIIVRVIIIKIIIVKIDGMMGAEHWYRLA